MQVQSKATNDKEKKTDSKTTVEELPSAAQAYLKSFRAVFPALDKKACCVVKVDGTIEQLKAAPIDLKTAQQLVGGYVELMPFASRWTTLKPILSKSGVPDSDLKDLEKRLFRTMRRILLADEEGKLRGKERNAVITNLVGFEVVGDVIVCESEFFE